MSANPFLLAADNSPDLLPLLRENPSRASEQDSHGYSLVHAAASYNHLDLLRTLIREFNVDVNLRDEDEETALFVVETVEAARVLVEELGADVSIKGSDGYTAFQKIDEEGEFPEVAEYLKTKEEAGHTQTLPNGANGTNGTNADTNAAPPVPQGLNISLSTVAPTDETELEVDPEFRRRIEELAGRDDFNSDAGQAALRQLVEDAIAERNLADRNVRSRQD
ncbi:ankyrin repeat-containing protein [Daldinia caldariorum]|uniref:ankyrin repeat-containing protein n=1 Tax=Daldinia caldariorum TaxID=326644 RepID=UPI002007BAAC|nr:ankyrin repeat-containing protein [Daldinia caldariorum]KAI1467677.1 ankyrin repeat-containing protein [Daldinia caldariorum]